MALLHLDESHAEVCDTGTEDYPVKVHGANAGVTGRFGTAFRFDGKDDYIEVGATLCFPFQTIELWVKPNAERAAGGIISSQAQPGSSNWRWRLVRNEDKTVSFHLYDGTQRPQPVRTAKSQSQVPDGVWTHLAVTIDTSQAQETALYVNGKRKGAARALTNVPFGNLFLGTATVEEYFAGDVDEVVVLDRALPPETIAAHARAEKPFPSSVVAKSDSIVMRPVGDRAWFTFKHPQLGRRQWMFRMPEHMYYDEKAKRSHIPYGVRWEVQPDRTRLRFWCGLSEEKKRELCLDFWGQVVAHKDTIDYELRVKNVGDAKWRRMHMGLFCLQSGRAAGFLDYEAKRTFVRKDGRWITMNEVVKGEFKSHRMCGIGVRHKGKPGSERLAARVSEDGKFVLGIATDIATSLSFNFQNRIACLHSNPSWGLLKPGEATTAKGKIYLFQGTLDDLWELYCADFAPGR